jgi:glucose-6-phosphate isomerase
MHLANQLNTNAFDQPNVEEYKEATRRILSGK